MRRIALAVFLLTLPCTALQAQDKVPEAMQQRLIAFTDQLWATWMKSGDIRSVASMRVPEVLNDPPCEIMLMFMGDKLCKEATREERADYKQTMDNVIALMTYRILSQPLLELAATADKSHSNDPFAELFKGIGGSDAELSLANELEGEAKDIDEFRRRLPRYRELEKMFQADHLKNFTRSGAQYQENIALLDQATRSSVGIFKVDSIPDGIPQRGDYFVVPKGLLVFIVRVTSDDMKLAFAQMLTK